MGKVRYQGAKNGPPTTEPDPDRPDSWSDPYKFMDFGFWMNDRPGDYFKQGFDPNDNRSIGTRLKDAWGAGMAAAENFKGVRFPYWAQNFQQPAQGALTLWAAGNAALGTKDWRTNWSGQGGQAATQAPAPYYPPAGTQYNQGAANTSGMSNADILAQKQYDMIAARKAERLAGAPDWVKQIYNQPAQTPTQGYYQAPVYQAAPRQMYQAQGNYQPQGNPYHGRVPENLKRGGQWEKQHNAWVQNIRRARLKVKG